MFYVEAMMFNVNFKFDCVLGSLRSYSEKSHRGLGSDWIKQSCIGPLNSLPLIDFIHVSFPIDSSATVPHTVHMVKSATSAFWVTETITFCGVY